MADLPLTRCCKSCGQNIEPSFLSYCAQCVAPAEIDMSRAEKEWWLAVNDPNRSLRKEFPHPYESAFTTYFFRCVIAVAQSNDFIIPVSGIPEKYEWLFEYGATDIFEGCEDTLPKEPGVYLCDLQYWYTPGYCEGQYEPSESNWGVQCVSYTKLALY